MKFFNFHTLLCLLYSIGNLQCSWYNDYRVLHFHSKHKFNNVHHSFHQNAENLLGNYRNFDPVAFTETHHHHLRHHHDEISWPVKKEAIVEGDLILGGLMMVHEREDSVTCGPIMPQGGIQALEAMLFTLDALNSRKHPILPNITLGAHILDDCDKDTYGLEMAVDFIKGRFALLYVIFNRNPRPRNFPVVKTQGIS